MAYLVLVRSMQTPPAITVALIAALCAGCCEESLRSEQRSPSGAWLVIVNISDCGVLGGDYGTAVSLRARHWFRGKDQLVIAVEGKHDITVAWRDDHTLVVNLPTSTKIDVKNDIVAGVHIEYGWPF
jgi:hypothetical protein